MPFPKEQINAALVSRLVSAQFPQWAELAIRPVEPSGWDNRTFRLGDALSARLPSAEWYALQVEKEQHWLPKLAPHLPLAIPAPVARGAAAFGYPWSWSVYRWLTGESALLANIAEPVQFAVSLAEFLLALQQVDAAGGPQPGPHNFFRGGPLTTYDAETRQAAAALAGEIDAAAANAVWDAALRADWLGAPVWLHGDVSAGNLLVEAGRLCAVIDFGCAGVGDPACDLTIAWTFFFGESRTAFRAAIGADEATWARARGWALWKALITLAEHIDSNPAEAEKARRVIADVLAGD